MINSNKIRARIVELGMSNRQVAEAIGMSPKTFCIKLKTGKFGLEEATGMIRVLRISNPVPYFFIEEVNCEDTNMIRQEGA